MDTTNKILPSSQQTAAYQWADSVWFQIFLITILGLGVFFRFAGLGNKVYSHDETFLSLHSAGYSIDDAKGAIWNGEDQATADVRKFVKPAEDKNITDTLSILALYEPHEAPLIFLLAHFWMRLVGYEPTAMRLLAALLGLLSIPAIYWLGSELFQSRRVALLATAFLAISPYQVLFAQDARPYSLWSLAILVSTAALLRAMRRDEKSSWRIYSLTLILGMYTQQLFALVIIAHGCYFIAMFLTYRQKRITGFISAGLFSFLAYTPWLFFMINGWEYVVSKMGFVNTQFPWNVYIQRWVMIFSSPLLDLDLKSGNLIPYILRGLILLLIAYGLVFLVRHGSRREWVLIVLIYLTNAGVLMGLDLFPGGSRSTNGRYFVPANLATLLVMAYFSAALLDRSASKIYVGGKILVGLLVTAGIVSNLNSMVAETWWNKEISRIQPALIHMIDKDDSVLIVSGYRSTNLGDVLSISLQVDSNIHFRIYRKPDDIKYPSNYDQIYWLPSSCEEVQVISQKKGFRVKEILPNTLWQIEGR